MSEFGARCARWRVPAGFVIGLVGLWLARPTWGTLGAGAAIAGLGEALRVWAAGHLVKGREVTASGPYRWVRHPLYLGSALLGIGFAVAANRVSVAALVLTYLAIAMGAAVRAEERWLAAQFGEKYAAYRFGRLPPSRRRFSLARLRENREGRAVVGILVVVALLALKAASRGGR